MPEAAERGYTQEVLGAPIYPVAGALDKYFYARPVGYRSLEKVHIAGNIADADAMIVLSHGKGHGQCGFGGAIKNIAMGCVTEETRGWIHSLMDTEFSWNAEACTPLLRLPRELPRRRHHVQRQGRVPDLLPPLPLLHALRGLVPGGRHQHQPGEHPLLPGGDGPHHQGRARHVRAEPRALHHLHDEHHPAVRLLGVHHAVTGAGHRHHGLDDIVAIEQASIDSIDAKNYIPGSLPEQVKMTDSDEHLLKRIWEKDPYLQVESAADLGLGSRDYTLDEIP